MLFYIESLTRNFLCLIKAYTCYYEFVSKQSVQISLPPNPSKKNYVYKNDDYYHQKLKEILPLYRSRNDKISFKSKKIRKYKTKKEILFEKNENIKYALELHDQGYKNNYICQLLLIKKNQLNYMIDKRKKGKIRIIRGRSRPRKIKISYIKFLQDYYGENHPIVSILWSKKVLSDNF